MGDMRDAQENGGEGALHQQWPSTRGPPALSVGAPAGRGML